MWLGTPLSAVLSSSSVKQGTLHLQQQKGLLTAPLQLEPWEHGSKMGRKVKVTNARQRPHYSRYDYMPR